MTILQSFIGTVFILLENHKRINDYSIFLFPRIIEGVWYLFKRLTKKEDVKGFLKVLFSILIGIILVLRRFYMSELPDAYLRQYEFFFCDN